MPNLLRQLRGSTPQRVMASEFAIKQQTWSSWETGRTKPAPAQMQMIENYFNLRKEKIFFALFDYNMKLSNEV